MLRLAGDENFDGYIARRLKSLMPDLDFVRIQDSPVYKADDVVMLEWVATENRILLTHDYKTIPKYAYQRVYEGKFMPGVFMVPKNVPIDEIAEDILTLVRGSFENEWENQMSFYPCNPLKSRFGMTLSITNEKPLYERLKAEAKFVLSYQCNSYKVENQMFLIEVIKY